MVEVILQIIFLEKIPVSTTYLLVYIIRNLSIIYSKERNTIQLDKHCFYLSVKRLELSIQRFLFLSLILLKSYGFVK